MHMRLIPASDQTQGKSLSLICAAVTWLRNHKKAKYEAAVEDAASAFKDEPDWIVEQMLKRKREEVVQRWEERETKLERIRATEKLRENRGSKRRRLNDDRSTSNATDDHDEDEWLLQDREDLDSDAGGGSSGFSKETRSLMDKLGMGLPIRGEDDEDRADEPVKVSSMLRSRIVPFNSCRYTIRRGHIRNLHSSYRSCGDRTFHPQYHQPCWMVTSTQMTRA